MVEPKTARLTFSRRSHVRWHLGRRDRDHASDHHQHLAKGEGQYQLHTGAHPVAALRIPQSERLNQAQAEKGEQRGKQGQRPQEKLPVNFARRVQFEVPGDAMADDQ
jgi:hypothetical protein